jgi:hypothetical protein
VGRIVSKVYDVRCTSNDLLMAGREPDAFELRAGEIVAALLMGQAVSRDGLGAPDGMHDYDVDLVDGRRVALEVTTATDSDLESLHHAASPGSGRPKR